MYNKFMLIFIDFYLFLFISALQIFENTNPGLTVGKNERTISILK